MTTYKVKFNGRQIDIEADTASEAALQAVNKYDVGISASDVYHLEGAVYRVLPHGSVIVQQVNNNITADTDKYQLEVFECQCGFHIGLDASYLDQVGDITLPCPSCERPITTNEH